LLAARVLWSPDRRRGHCWGLGTRCAPMPDCDATTPFWRTPITSV